MGENVREKIRKLDEFSGGNNEFKNKDSQNEH